MERTSDYWFMIEPYVHINIANGYMLLYNTLDKETIISNNEKVINLLEELLQDENCGVTILKNEQYRQNDIHSFITNLREKYMGDIIDISLSKGKPIQILPHTNFCNKRNEKYNFIKNANLLHFLNEIIIHLDHILDQDKLIDYLQSMPDNITYSISGDLKHIAKFDKLVDFAKSNAIDLTAPGDAIVAIGTVGIEETAYILGDEQMYGKLLTRFSARYLEPVKECEAWIPIEDEAAVAGKFGVKVMHDASDGGIFGALWDMALGTHRGFRVDLKAIPFRQEIVEISTYLGLNPYRMKSSGCFIAVTPDGAGLVEAMRREGMPACIIGYTTDNNDKILCNDEEISYLERK